MEGTSKTASEKLGSIIERQEEARQQQLAEEEQRKVLDSQKLKAEFKDRASEKSFDQKFNEAADKPLRIKFNEKSSLGQDAEKKRLNEQEQKHKAEEIQHHQVEERKQPEEVKKQQLGDQEQKRKAAELQKQQTEEIQQPEIARQEAGKDISQTDAFAREFAKTKRISARNKQQEKELGRDGGR